MTKVCKMPDENVRIAFLGDSITWGDGMLDDSFVAGADEYIRCEWADTIHAQEMELSGLAERVESRKFYQGSALKLTKAGSQVSFSLTGNELSIVQGIERGFESHKSWIELYVDGVLHDTFSNVNSEPRGTAELQFIGDGRTDRFDLQCSNTYGHIVTVDGKQLSGAHNEAGYGGTFPAEQDYVVIRKYARLTGQDELVVHHYLWLKQPPQPGARIAVHYNYGENIAYAKTTIGETAADFPAPLESRFGDKTLEVTAAVPTEISTGLDFRQTDDRAVRTWRFPTSAKREFVLRIKELDRQAEQGSLPVKAEPYFIINFATNRFHQITNAGIGGWTAYQFNQRRGLHHIDELLREQQDIVFIELGTNDDWLPGNQFTATRCIEVMEEQLRRLPVLYLKSCRLNSSGSFAVDTAELIAAEVTATSIKIKSERVCSNEVRKGDVISIGNYYGDNRNIQSRVIEHWDEARKIAAFSKPLHPTPTADSLEKLAGQAVTIKRIDGYIEQMSRLIDSIQQRNQNTQIILVDTGLSNYHTRLLMGYPEKLNELATQKKVGRAHVYPAVLKWQYSQDSDTQVYIGGNEAQVSTGASEYDLLSADGRDVQRSRGMQLRHWSVKVDGMERYGDGCFVDGGYAVAFKPTLAREQLLLVDWESHQRGKNLKLEYRFIPSKLKFTHDIPPVGAVIDVKVASNKWSFDDTHLNRQGGVEIYTKVIVDVLKELHKLLI